MFCPNCGKLMNDGDSFCGNCGARFPSTNDNQPMGYPNIPNQNIYYKPINPNSVINRSKGYFTSMKTPNGLDIPKVLIFSVACAQLLSFIFFLFGGISAGSESMTFLGALNEVPHMGLTVFFTIVLLIVPLCASILKLFKLFLSGLAYDIIILAVSPILLSIVLIVANLLDLTFTTYSTYSSYNYDFRSYPSLNFGAVMYIIFEIVSIGITIFNVVVALKNIKSNTKTI